MTATKCPHHWIIETPDGPMSIGRCRLCGEEREFSNTVDTWAGWTIQSKPSPEYPLRNPQRGEPDER